MKTISPWWVKGASRRRWLLQVGMAAVFTVGWGFVQLRAAEPVTSLPPPPEVVKLQKIPVLRLPKLVYPAKAQVAEGKSNQESSESKRRDKKTVITGSKIPRKAVDGRLVVTASPVVVIDRREMSRTGAQTASQLFGRMPFGR